MNTAITSHIHTTDKRNLKAVLLLIIILPIYLVYQHLAKQPNMVLGQIAYYAHKITSALLRALGIPGACGKNRLTDMNAD